MYVLSRKLKLDLEQPLQPYEYFDMIAGTSTGGLIAIMLGTLQMTTKECIDAYMDLSPKVFPIEGFALGNKIIQLVKKVSGRARFDAKAMEEEVKKLVANHLDQGPDAVFEQIGTSSEGCHVYV